MTVQEIQREQERLLPKEDLRSYAGQWVAVRDGRVVGADLDPIALRDKPDVEPDDVLMPVPASDDGVFIL